MALQDSILRIKDADNTQFALIRSWNKMRWDKKAKVLVGAADMELLDKLAGIVRLPPDVEHRRARLHAVQKAVDRERVNPEPQPLFQYPVKLPLYAHQTRACNMTLLTFGWVEPERGQERGTPRYILKGGDAKCSQKKP